MRTDLYRHHKVCKMADLLGDKEGPLARFVYQNCQSEMTVTRNVTRNAIIGALVSVWGVARQRGKRRGVDLILEGANIHIIDDIADISGFGESLLEVGWLEIDDVNLVFPRFFEEMNVDPNDEYREKNAARQRRYRDKNRKINEGMSNDSNVTCNASESSQSNGRVEKSKSKSNNNILIPVTDSGDREPSEKSEPILTFQTEGKPGEWHLTDYWLSDIQKLYPSLDCLGESRKALAWIKAKPTRRKTARGMEAFLTNWFNNATDGRRSNGHANGTARIAEGMSIKESVEQLARQKGII